MKQASTVLRRWLVFAVVLATSAVAHAAEEAGTALEHHVDTHELHGINLLLAELYNDHRLLYATVATVSMAVFGIVIAFAVDAILNRLGFRLSKMEHRE
jgi:hypothetical protein